VTEAFLQHYNDERPHQGRACGNVPPRVAFPTLPTLPALPERVDPDAWLAALDQKMYLRHVGRDGCVDVDLVTYYIGLQMAGRAVLLQVVAQSRQFAVWHQDQIVKRLPIKGLVGQEMALDEYLQYIQQEALAALRRASVRGGRQNPTAVSLGGRSLIVSCIRRRSQLLASHSGKCGKPFVSCQAQVPGNQKQAVAWAALLSDFPLLFLTRFCFALSRLSFSLFNLSQFDEPTQPEVTMTESHTIGATAHDAAHGAFMTLPPYTRTREGEVPRVESVK